MICPACQADAPDDASFCGCGKALGPFRYVHEELGPESWWHRQADRLAAFVGAPPFLWVHAVWFVAWVALNALVLSFDQYPYSLLSILLSIEAIFLTGILVISQNRQTAFADKRAELDYEVNVQTHRKILELEKKIDELVKKTDA